VYLNKILPKQVMAIKILILCRKKRGIDGATDIAASTLAAGEAKKQRIYADPDSAT